ncbi:hypothetical protein MARPO_0126s0003 [Marchantia polymorpha]|uniref:Uncharacterized protein n=1 Tax=Marchantia polymorpha TaxID=3197 RepID=A0A2R6W8W1_MARPO|nr:hypothetical protein MARPO_0126s0003 [Marchantia polymorpha]|eukprot:PTQ30281.1 hypothetical protein MARPO_0126s0003 [Marchantia polymorpha]
MKPPSEATYDDVDALKVACVQHAATHLYSVITKRSNYKMSVILLHRGKFDTRVITKIRLQDECHIAASRKSDTRDDRHDLKEAAHPSHRKMTNNVKERVRTLSVIGVAPAQIMTLIRSEPSGKHRALTRFVFTSTKAVKFILIFGMVLTIDCKTNRFHMPLHIVSFACTRATFTSAIAYLSAEIIENYKMMQAGMEDKLQKKLVQIQTEWMDIQLRAVQYMQYKTYFVGAYVDKMLHFDSSSSSDVQGAHLTLKQCVQVRTSDMMIVVERLLQFLADQYKTSILPFHSRKSHTILFIGTCSMTKYVELPTSIQSNLMLWTRLEVKEVARHVALVALIKIHLQFTINKEHAGRKLRPQPDPRFEILMILSSMITLYNNCAANQSLPMSAVHKWLIRCCSRCACHKLPVNIVNVLRTKRL